MRSSQPYLGLPVVSPKNISLTDVTKRRNGERGTGNGERGTGNGEWGMRNSGQR